MEHLISHIRRDGADIDRRIDMLQGPSFAATHIDVVISNILSGMHRYYVTVGPSLMHVAYVEVKRHPVSKRLFLQTVPDGRWDNNLYSLPEIQGLRRMGWP